MIYIPFFSCSPISRVQLEHNCAIPRTSWHNIGVGSMVGLGGELMRMLTSGVWHGYHYRVEGLGRGGLQSPSPPQFLCRCTTSTAKFGCESTLTCIYMYVIPINKWCISKGGELSGLEHWLAGFEADWQWQIGQLEIL